MQIKIFTIPILGGEVFNEELNVFLRSHRIISVEDQFVQGGGGGGWWVFKVQYGEGAASATDRERVRVDYKQVLEEETFKRFAALRDIRKKISDAESVPAFVIFTDEELSEMAKLEVLTEAGMKGIKGIGRGTTTRRTAASPIATTTHPRTATTTSASASSPPLRSQECGIAATEQVFDPSRARPGKERSHFGDLCTAVLVGRFMEVTRPKAPLCFFIGYMHHE